jgi:hypothetical protein
MAVWRWLVSLFSKPADAAIEDNQYRDRADREFNIEAAHARRAAEPEIPALQAPISGGDS